MVAHYNVFLQLVKESAPPYVVVYSVLYVVYIKMLN